MEKNKEIKQAVDFLEMLNEWLKNNNIQFNGESDLLYYIEMAFINYILDKELVSNDWFHNMQNELTNEDKVDVNNYIIEKLKTK